MEADEINDMGAVYPDGLTGEVIEALLGEARMFWAMSSRPTSAVQDGSAVARRDWRVARRELGAVVRAFPGRFVHDVADLGESA